MDASYDNALAFHLAGALFILWIGLAGAPLFSAVAFFSIRKRGANILLRAAAIGAACLFLFILFAWLRLGFTVNEANLVCFAIAYAAYCFLVATCWQIRVKALRALALAVFLTPILLGYVYASIGLLALGWIAADYALPPSHTEEMQAGLTCRVRQWGAAIGDSGYTVHLYRHWSALPFLEREVARISVNETNSQIEPQSATCADALSTYQAS